MSRTKIINRNIKAFGFPELEGDGVDKKSRHIVGTEVGVGVDGITITYANRTRSARWCNMTEEWIMHTLAHAHKVTYKKYYEKVLQ